MAVLNGYESCPKRSGVVTAYYVVEYSKQLSVPDFVTTPLSSRWFLRSSTRYLRSYTPNSTLDQSSMHVNTCIMYELVCCMYIVDSINTVRQANSQSSSYSSMHTDIFFPAQSSCYSSYQQYSSQYPYSRVCKIICSTSVLFKKIFYA